MVKAMEKQDGDEDEDTETVVEAGNVVVFEISMGSIAMTITHQSAKF